MFDRTIVYLSITKVFWTTVYDALHCNCIKNIKYEYYILKRDCWYEHSLYEDTRLGYSGDGHTTIKNIKIIKLNFLLTEYLKVI